MAGRWVESGGKGRGKQGVSGGAKREGVRGEWVVLAEVEEEDPTQGRGGLVRWLDC